MSDSPQADQEGDLAHPRTVYDLFGQDEAERQIAEAIATDRMHHAWMITGPKGLGKATLAYRIARRILGAKPLADSPLASDPSDPVCHQIEALSHPDFLLLRRPYDEKTKKIKTVLTVDEVRRAPDFFSRSASRGGWRVVIVDCADDMNVNSANALLKTLEEPPHKGLLLLVVHAPGRLPTTIRSRCRKLMLRSPEAGDTQAWLEREHHLDPETAAAATRLAQGAPGRALMLARSDAAKVKANLDQILSGLPHLNRAGLQSLAGQMSRKGQEGVWAIVMNFLVDYANDHARTAANSNRLSTAGEWAQCADDLHLLRIQSETIHLDAKQTLFSAFDLLEKTARAAEPT
ncbi:DNA polymerase III subunit delta' [Woodsholea maritima]|uniref:DNA polymerase III subunit delta' n=1 Tax=Woodsholea maritima TaxID=240237 RepID=UPI00037B1C09|nr:DNA polymerase III subunit delta' [Woodsholea maritima]